MAKKKSGLVGILAGPAMVLAAVGVLWKNEGRFDFYRAAKATVEIDTPSGADFAELISYTSTMDRELTMQGEYVDRLVGYLEVRRSAEVYCWHRERDDDRDKWTLRWSSSVESNSRNNGVSQQLTSNRFTPDEYAVGELPIDAKRIEFVDSRETIAPSTLQLTDRGTKSQLQVDGPYFVLRKHGQENLGDERIQYRGIPVPETATYFGKLSAGHGVAHQAVERNGWIDSLIQDSGVLHHLVAGDRPTALASIKGYLARLKWIVRGAGILAAIIGFWTLFGSMTSFLYHIPFLGSIAQKGAFLMAIVCGLLLSTTIIVVGNLVNHPLTLILLVVAIGGLIFFLRWRGRKSQVALKQNVDQMFGHTLSGDEMEELEFIELVHLAMGDNHLDVSEKAYLQKWAKKHGWDTAKTQQMFERATAASVAQVNDTATEDHLLNLVKLSLADGNVTSFEMQTIQRAAKDAGRTPEQVQKIMNQVRQLSG